MTFKMDDVVTIKHTLLSGAVKGAAVDNTTLEMQYLVEYSDNDGETQQRYFAVSQLDAG